jgi:hypothetical protein
MHCSGVDETATGSANFWSEVAVGELCTPIQWL